MQFKISVRITTLNAIIRVSAIESSPQTRWLATHRELYDAGNDSADSSVITTGRRRNCCFWILRESTTADKHSRDAYNLAALLFFFLFLDNLLLHVEGQGWGSFWPCSGRLEVVVLYVALSLLAHFAFWLRIVSGLNQERT